MTSSILAKSSALFNMPVFKKNLFLLSVDHDVATRRYCVNINDSSTNWPLFDACGPNVRTFSGPFDIYIYI